MKEKFYIDFSDESKYEASFIDLINHISGNSKAARPTKKRSITQKPIHKDLTKIDDFFFERTKARLLELKSKGKRALLLWDDSWIEKPESWFIKGLCSVYSSKAKQLTKIKRGYYHPPQVEYVFLDLSGQVFYYPI